MKMTRKIATILFIAFLASIWIAYGAYTIWTPNTVANMTDEPILEQIAQSDEGGDKNTNFTLSVTLKHGGVGMSSQTIHFHRSPDNSTWTQIGVGITNSDGLTTLAVNRTEVGTWYYKAGFDVLP